LGGCLGSPDIPLKAGVCRRLEDGSFYCPERGRRPGHYSLGSTRSVAYGTALPLVCPWPAREPAPRSGVVRAGSRSCRGPTYGPVGHVQVGLMISRSPNALGRALGAPYARTCEHPGAANATCGRIRRSGLDRRSSGLVMRTLRQSRSTSILSGPRLRGAGHAALTAWPPQDDVHSGVTSSLTALDRHRRPEPHVRSGSPIGRSCLQLAPWPKPPIP
jgi:hypothetical protein